MDTNFTNKIIAWLESDHDDDTNIIEGATLMLQCNRNRILYNNVVRKPSNFVDKIDYELRKHLRYRKDSLTIDLLVDLDKKTIPSVAKVLEDGIPDDNDEIVDEIVDDKSVKLGRRSDHDLLPVEIQALWSENASRYKKMKQLFETLKSMSSAEPCDRYEYLKPLKELYDNYHRDMQIYDNYKDGDEIHDSETSDGNQTIDFAKKLNACRKYISVNLKMVETSAEMDSKKKLEVCEAIKSKMDTLESLGAHLTDKIISRFNNVVSSTQNDLSEQQTERANTDKISEDESKES